MRGPPGIADGALALLIFLGGAGAMPRFTQSTSDSRGETWIETTGASSKGGKEDMGMLLPERTAAQYLASGRGTRSVLQAARRLALVTPQSRAM